MKIFKYICICFVASLIASCGNEYDTSEYFDLEELPGYVAFDADGNDVNVADTDLSEDGGVVGVTIENPTGTMSDITVNYTLGGTAVFGTDYTIDGATAAGGSVTITPVATDVALTQREDIVITPINNDIYEGDKTIILTLESASNASGEVAVGRGGKDFQKVANVNLIDDECPSEYGGAYTVTTRYLMLESAMLDPVDTVMDYQTTITKTGDFSYTIEEASGGLYTSSGLFGMTRGTTGMTLNVVEDCGSVTFVADQLDELGQGITMDGGNGVNGDGVFTISIATVEMVMGEPVVKEQFVSTYTPN